MADPSAHEEQVRELARAILERSRYSAFRPESYDGSRYLSDAWRELTTFLLELYDRDRRLYWLLVIALGAVCLALVAHIAWTLAGALRAPPPVPPPEHALQEVDFVRQAAELAQGGQHLEAAHRLLLASLRALAQGRHIPLQPEDGNRAVCRKLAQSRLPEALREQLIVLIGQTERAWFGAAADASVLGAELYGRWHVAHAQLARMAPS